MSKNNIINFLKQHKDIYPEYFEKNRLQKIFFLDILFFRIYN